jgi:diguanylate cyclase (GGDEF)-like protein
MLERSAKLIERGLAGRKGAAILLVDIDNFKAINDGYGHAVGDRVLREVASRLAASCRSGDLLGRIGGEEFMAVFADLVPDQAGPIAERLREAVCGEPVSIGEGGSLAASVSGGLLALAPGDAESFDLTAAMNQADGALYAAKEAGRNRILPVDPAA